MKIHYAGALRIVKGSRSTDILSGWAACCTGEKAWKIKLQGNHTYEPSDVTCKACLARMNAATVL